MKHKLIFLLSLFICVSSYAQLSYTTATVTISAGTVNGETITVNGNQRLWTNSVLNFNTQIQTTNTAAAVQTNLYQSFLLSPLTHQTIYLIGSTQVVFQSDPGYPMVITFNPSGGGVWATVSYDTIDLSTNWTSFRGNASIVGPNELTNTANGIESFLASVAITSAIPCDAPAMANFICGITLTNDLITLSNFCVGLSVNSTNYTLTASNNLYAEMEALANDATNYTLTASNNLVTVLSGGLSYLDGSGNIKLVDGNTTLRFEQDKGGFNYMYDSTGATIFSADTSQINWLTAGVQRFTINLPTSANGDILFRDTAGNVTLTMSGANDRIRTYAGISFNQSSLPAMAEGTVTNYFADQSNSGTTETAVNQLTVPANTFVANGDTMRRTIGVKTAANSNSKTVKVYYDGTLCASATTTTSAAYIFVTVEVTRDSASSYRTMASATIGSGTGGGTAGSAFAYVNEVSGEVWTSSAVFKVTLTGGATSDLTAVIDRIEYAPSSLDN